MIGSGRQMSNKLHLEHIEKNLIKRIKQINEFQTNKLCQCRKLVMIILIAKLIFGSHWQNRQHYFWLKICFSSLLSLIIKIFRKICFSSLLSLITLFSFGGSFLPNFCSKLCWKSTTLSYHHFPFLFNVSSILVLLLEGFSWLICLFNGHINSLWIIDCWNLIFLVFWNNTDMIYAILLS